jgi:transposase
VGDAARIRAKQVKKQKNDRQDAQHLLKLLLKDDFPRIWVPTPENRDRRQLLLHRHRLVQMRTRVMNQLQAVAMNEGIRRKRGLWTRQGRAELESLWLPTWTSRRRQELLELVDQLDPSIDQLSQAIEQEAEQQPEVQRLMTHPGVGPITALAFVLVLGTPQRFSCGKQVASYLGLIPREHSSGGRQKLGTISKQGNRFVRLLLVEAVQNVTRVDESFRKPYQQRCHRMAKGVAKVAAARRLAVRLFWMMRTQTAYPEIVRIESSPRVPLVD